MPGLRARAARGDVRSRRALRDPSPPAGRLGGVTGGGSFLWRRRREPGTEFTARSARAWGPRPDRRRRADSVQRFGQRRFEIVVGAGRSGSDGASSLRARRSRARFQRQRTYDWRVGRSRLNGASGAIDHRSRPVSARAWRWRCPSPPAWPCSSRPAPAFAFQQREAIARTRHRRTRLGLRGGFVTCSERADV